jgi:CheY-like chemotaxis protein
VLLDIMMPEMDGYAVLERGGRDVAPHTGDLDLCPVGVRQRGAVHRLSMLGTQSLQTPLVLGRLRRP